MKRALILVAVLLVGVPAVPARAGTFVVSACGAGGVNDAWHATPPPPGVMETNETCHADLAMDGIWVRDVLASSTDLTDGQGAWLRFDAAPGTHVAGITYKRWLWKVSIDDLHPELRTGEGTVLETCSITFGNDRCDLGGEGTPAVSFTGLDTSQLEVGVICQILQPPATTCPGGGTQHGYGAVITDASVTIEDDTPPAAPSIAASGLWSGAPWYRDSSSVTVSGTDASGVAAVRIYSDGQLVQEQSATCDFTQTKPCPDASDLQVPFDTAGLADGTHDISVALVDAAGNESAAVTRNVLIANDSPAAPHLTITPEHATSPKFTVSWTPAVGQSVPIALAHVTICHGTCTQTTTAASSIQATAPGPGTTSVSVYLEDIAGNASPTNASTGSFAFEPVTQPPGKSADPPGGSHDPTTTRVNPSLRLATIASRSHARILVRLNPRATGTIMVAIRWELRHDRRHRWSAWRRHRVSIHDGRARLRLRRPRYAVRVRVVASYPGSSGVRAAVVRRVARLS